MLTADAIAAARAHLQPTTTVERTLIAPAAPPPSATWVKTPSGGWREVLSTDQQGSRPPPPRAMSAPPHEMHGQLHGFERERNAWQAPVPTFVSEAPARPGYDTLDASEYRDAPEVLEAKISHLARLIQSAKCCVVYAGAGLSTGAGIRDYATQNHSSDAAPTAFTSPMCAQPTLSHRVLVGLYRAGKLHRLIQQNHDGLPQKAGLPQHAINEIHGSLYAPDNPVIPMSGRLRTDLLDDLLTCERDANLVVAVGTSLAGMNADRIVHAAAARAQRPQHARSGSDAAALGSVIIGLQRTTADPECTLRIFAPCDIVFEKLAACLLSQDGDSAAHVLAPRPAGEYFCPPVLQQPRLPGCGAIDDVVATGSGASDASDDARYLLHGLHYDAMGRRHPGAPASAMMPLPTTAASSREETMRATTSLDLREGACVLIPSGPHAGARGEVIGYDREGHVRCRFALRLKADKPFKAPMTMTVGVWWLQAARDATVEQIPVVNPPPPDEHEDGAVWEGSAQELLRSLQAAYE